MNKTQNLGYFERFKRDNREIYIKAKEILTNIKFNSNIYFDTVDLLLAGILDNYNTIERQIIAKSIISEVNSSSEILFDIFPADFVNKPNEIEIKESPDWLELLYSSNNQEKEFEFY